METLLVNVLGLTLIAWIVWYFFLSRRSDQAMATATGGVQEIQVTVKGGYIPETVVARPGVPLRILFRREETSPCSEEVVFADFGIRRQLAAFETTVVEIPASAAGSYGFACGMDMMHGRLVLAESPVVAAGLPAMPEPPGGAPVAQAPDKTNWPVDPICGMKVNPAKPAGTSEKNGVTYYFCNPGCKERFDRGEGPRTMMASSEHRVSLDVRRKA